MMLQLIVWLDLAAGVLVGAQFLLSQRLHERTDNWLRRVITLPSDAKDPGHKASLWVSIIATSIFFVGVTTYGVIQDLGKATFSSGELAISTGMILVGAILGIGALVGLVLARRKLHCLGRLDPIRTVMTASLVLGILPLLSLLRIPSMLFPGVIGFTSGSLVMGVIMEGVPLARHYLTFKGGVLARLGLLLFIISKVIQLTSY